jgi:hypothetical protein
MERDFLVVAPDFVRDLRTGSELVRISLPVEDTMVDLEFTHRGDTPPVLIIDSFGIFGDLMYCAQDFSDSWEVDLTAIGWEAAQNLNWIDGGMPDAIPPFRLVTIACDVQSMIDAAACHRFSDCPDGLSEYPLAGAGFGGGNNFVGYLYNAWAMVDWYVDGRVAIPMHIAVIAANENDPNGVSEAARGLASHPGTGRSRPILLGQGGVPRRNHSHTSRRLEHLQLGQDLASSIRVWLYWRATMTRTPWLIAACTTGILVGACHRTAMLECYPLDPHSPVALAEIDPVEFILDNYCGRGKSSLDSLQRNLAYYCVPLPEEGCDPCQFEADEVDELIHEVALARIEEGDCPDDYQPEAVVRGCFAEWVDTPQCCWVAEFFTDAEICDLQGPSTIP